MNVSAVIVTRGDQPMQRVIDSLPSVWEILVWVNGDGVFLREGTDSKRLASVPDLAVFGRYAAIEHASHDLIYVQDDDCIVSDPQAIVAALRENLTWNEDHQFHDSYVCNCEVCAVVVCNMPEQFRHGGYTDHALVGFGAAFHRDLPERAFERFCPSRPDLGEFAARNLIRYTDVFYRTCDVVFTGLTPRVLVDVPYQDREFASDPGRMWTTPGHVEERQRMLDLVRRVRDG